VYLFAKAVVVGGNERSIRRLAATLRVPARGPGPRPPVPSVRSLDLRLRRPRGRPPHASSVEIIIPAGWQPCFSMGVFPKASPWQAPNSLTTCYESLGWGLGFIRQIAANYAGVRALGVEYGLASFRCHDTHAELRKGRGVGCPVGHPGAAARSTVIDGRADRGPSERF
jgi:hypothetical protein